MKILVLCTGNSCRSQMAEGYLRYFSKGAVEVYSAGVETHGVNPNAVKIMAMDGIDISNHTSNNVEEYKNIEFDYIFTVCDNAKERCPYIVSDAHRIHHSFPDPASATGTEQEILSIFATTRDMIKTYCENLIMKFEVTL